MPMSPEEQSYINDVRLKTVAGTATLAELQRAIIIMRSGRKLAVEASAAGRAKRAGKTKVVIDSDAALAELEGLGG